MSLRLRLSRPPRLRLDLRGLTPAALNALSRAEVERHRVGLGRDLVPLGQFFDVSSGGDGDALVFEGDLSRCDRIGWRLGAGRIVADGPVGDYAGSEMTGGELHVSGDAGLLTASEMAGGRCMVDGSVGDFAAASLPGSLDGMRGGCFVVRGNAGQRFGDRMRRGSALVHGDVAAFLGSRMVAGSIAVGGRAAGPVGYGMRRGSLVFAGAAPEVGATFVDAIADVDVFWQLLARDLARHGGPFTGLARRGMRRHLGDLAADGKGELIVVA